MDAKEEQKELKTIDEISEDIRKTNSILYTFEEELKYTTKLTEKINSFIIDYQKFEGIKRFSIPVIGKINCGKSTILNFLLDLDDVLEYSCDVTTKFISIIRHNKNLKGKPPLIYNVEFEQRAYINNKYLYNFEKNGKYIEGNVKDIIKKRNEQLTKAELDKLPENYFYIIECYIPLFEGEYEKYADYFEFMDVPGLNEGSFSENLDNIYLDKILPLFVNNVQFAIFIFDTLNYEKKENSTINLRDIFFDFYKKMKEFYFNENKEKVKIHASILILNKIDLSHKEGGLQKEECDFKHYLENTLKISVQNNSIVLFQADLEYLKKNRFESFEKYLDYIIKTKKDDNDNNINKQIKKNFKIDFNINDNILKEESEDEDEDEEDENHDDDISNLIKKINKSLNKQSYSDSITKKKYSSYLNIYNTYRDNAKKNFKENLEENDLTKNIKKSIENVYKNFINNYKKYMSLYDKVLLELSKKKGSILDNKNKNTPKIITFENIFEEKNFLDIFTYENSIFEDLKKMEPNHEFFETIYNNFLLNKDYIEKWHRYKIAIFGEHSSGKSSLLNSLIGIDILQESNAHCTKVILVIQYTQSKKDLSLYSANLNHNESFLYFTQDKLIANGEDEIREELKNINNNNKKDQEINYYILNTPIKFLDLFIEDKDIKEKIQFIDTPGLDSLLKEYTDYSFSELIEYIDLFIYTNAYNIINQKESKASIKRMIEFILEKKGYFNFNSFIFLINFYDKIDIKEDSKEKEILENFKSNITEIIKKYKENNWDAYINKYKKIINNDSNISCFYFSKNIFNNEQKAINQFLDFQNFFTQLNNTYSKVDIKQKLINIKSHIKKKLYEKIRKKKFSKEDIQITDKDRKDLKIILDINNNDFEAYKKNVDSILSKYKFIKKNIINYSIFNGFLSALKEKLSKENIYAFLSFIIFNQSVKIIRYFELIENNILRWESSQNIKIPINEETKIKYDFYKKKMEDEFINFKKELKKNIDDIFAGKDKKEEINKDFKSLFEKIESYFKSFVKDCQKELKKLDEIVLSFKKEDIQIKINLKEFMKLSLTIGVPTSLFFMLIFGAAAPFITEGLLFSLGITSFITGGILGFGIGGIISVLFMLLIYGLLKWIGKIKSKIQMYNDIMRKLEPVIFKVNKDMDSFYNSIKNQIKETIMSIRKPMKNLIENKINRKEFFELKDNFIKFLLMLNKKNEILNNVYK